MIIFSFLVIAKPGITSEFPRKFNKRTAFVAACVLVHAIFINMHLYSQEYLDSASKLRFNYGFYALGGFNLHTANFSEFPGIPSCCPRYETGSGSSISAGLFAAFPINQQIESFMRVGWHNYSGKLTRSEPVLLAGIDGRGVDGEFIHTVDAKLAAVEFYPGAAWIPVDGLRLFGGLKFALMIQKDYSQKEEISKPDYGTFTDTKSRIRHAYSGEIPNASSLLFGVGFGASYDFPLNKAKTLLISPMINMHLGLSSVGENMGWKPNNISAGIALRFAPRRLKPPPPLQPPLPPLPEPDSLEKPLLACYAVTITDDGKESPVSTFRQEEFLTTQMHPVLNYVFFEENSPNLPSRYKLLSRRDASAFDFNKLFNYKTIDVYSHVLNIVGKRMRSNPNAKITIIGCNSNSGKEQNNLELSKMRAQSVKDYLVNVFGVEEARLKIDAVNLPKIPSNNSTKDGMEENRRVELIATDSEIFKPIVIEDTLRESTIPVIRFKSESLSNVELTDWKIETVQSGKPLRTFSGKGSPPAKLEWNLKIENEFKPGFDNSIEYLLTVNDKNGFSWQSGWWALPVEKVTVEKKAQELIADKRIDRFSLILFDFNQATLGAENQKIAEIARKSIKENSVVTIKGFTDRVGEDRYNMELSLKRAKAVAEILGLDPGVAVGLGKTQLLFDNNLPEGRFYCRTVTIEVVTPVR